MRGKTTYGIQHTDVQCMDAWIGALLTCCSASNHAESNRVCAGGSRRAGQHHGVEEEGVAERVDGAAEELVLRAPRRCGCGADETPLAIRGEVQRHPVPTIVPQHQLKKQWISLSAILPAGSWEESKQLRRRGQPSDPMLMCVCVCVPSRQSSILLPVPGQAS